MLKNLSFMGRITWSGGLLFSIKEYNQSVMFHCPKKRRFKLLYITIYLFFLITRIIFFSWPYFIYWRIYLLVVSLCIVQFLKRRKTSCTFLKRKGYICFCIVWADCHTFMCVSMPESLPSLCFAHVWSRWLSLYNLQTCLYRWAWGALTCLLTQCTGVTMLLQFKIYFFKLNIKHTCRHFCFPLHTHSPLVYT